MYIKLVLATCLLAFFAVVLSAYARLSDAGLGCANWPVCYEEIALKESQQSHTGAARVHSSWQWKLHSQVVQLLGILAIAVCGLSWKKRNELRQSPLLPTLLLGLMMFLAVFGVWAFHVLTRPVIVAVHLAGGIVMLMLLVWIALRQMYPDDTIDAVEAQQWRIASWLALVLVLAQTMGGGWVSSNFAAIACTEFPLCKGSLLPAMDFSYAQLPLSVEQLTAIHWLHRIGALVVVSYLAWLSTRIMKVTSLRFVGGAMLGLVVFQFVLGVFNVLTGLPLAGAVLHNTIAMLILVALVTLLFMLEKTRGERRRSPY